MSSPLDGRIRALAREEASALDSRLAIARAERASELEAQVADLHDAVLLLGERLDALEKAPGQTAQEDRPTARRPVKKTSTPPTTPE